METGRVDVPEKSAVVIYTMANFFTKVNLLCHDKCVVDFQTKDVSAMETTCLNKCIYKQMHVFREMQSPEFLSQ